MGNALDRPEQLPLAGARSSGGIYAPTLRHHDGLFWLVTTNVSGAGHVIYTAQDPRGPWSDPVAVDGAVGIDPDLAWDAGGTCWLTYSELGGDGLDAVSGQIKQVRLDPRSGHPLEAPRALWSGTGLQFPEAPHLYEIDGTWYLLIAEGGTGPGHAVSIARGVSPLGPFEGCPHNPILSHRSTNHPVQNTGHADLVQAPDGSWWMVLLGIRRGGAIPEVHVLGRETFLTPVRWVDGWPEVRRSPWSARARGSAPARRLPGTGARPGVDLGAHAPRRRLVADRTARLARPARPRRLDRHARAGLRRAPPAAPALHRPRGGRRRPRPRRPGVRIDESHFYAVEAGDGEVRCHARVGPFTRTTALHPAANGAVLRIDAVPDPRATGPICCA